MTGVICTDGGAADPKEPRLRRAAWAAWNLRPEMPSQGLGLRGQVEGEDQTVLRGELTAVLRALQVAMPP
eukprot:1655607-Alexandrium_andersonii.AAC.1